MTLDRSYLVEQHIDWIANISALEEVSFWVPDRTLIESDTKRPRHWIRRMAAVYTLCHSPLSGVEMSSGLQSMSSSPCLPDLCGGGHWGPHLSSLSQACGWGGGGGGGARAQNTRTEYTENTQQERLRVISASCAKVDSHLTGSITQVTVFTCFLLCLLSPYEWIFLPQFPAETVVSINTNHFTRPRQSTYILPYLFSWGIRSCISFPPSVSPGVLLK